MYWARRLPAALIKTRETFAESVGWLLGLPAM
jgi:hypothetical protein